MSVEKMGGSVEIDYKGTLIDVPKFDRDYAISRLLKLTIFDRNAMMKIIDDAIALNLPKLEELDPEAALELLQDIAIWHANEIIEGRTK